MNPCDKGKLTQKCLLAQKSREIIRRKNAKTKYCPFMCSYLQETGKCATSGADSDFYFRWGVG